MITASTLGESTPSNLAGRYEAREVILSPWLPYRRLMFIITSSLLKYRVTPSSSGLPNAQHVQANDSQQALEQEWPA